MDGERDEGMTLASNNRTTLSLCDPQGWNIAVIVAFIVSTVCFVAVILNAYVLLSLFWIKRGSLSATLRLNISLLISDALVLFVMAVSFFENTVKIHAFGICPESQCFPLALESIRLGGMLTGVLHLCVLAVNHYLSILSPFTYKSIMSPLATNLVLVIIWLLPVASLITYFSAFEDIGFRNKQCKLGKTAFEDDLTNVFQFRLAFLLVFSVALVAMVFMYSHIFFLLRKLRMQLTHTVGEPKTNGVLIGQAQQQYGDPISSAASSANRRRSSCVQSRSSQLKRKQSTMVTAVLIVSTFLIGWLPSLTVFISICIKGCPVDMKLRRQYATTIYVVSSIATSLIVVKTFVNPLIYGRRIPEIKDALEVMNHRIVQLVGKRSQPVLVGDAVGHRSTINTVATAIDSRKSVAVLAESSPHCESQVLLPASLHHESATVECQNFEAQNDLLSVILEEDATPC